MKELTGLAPSEGGEGESAPGHSSHFWWFGGKLGLVRSLDLWAHLLTSAFMFTWCSPCVMSVSRFPLHIRKTVMLDKGPTLLRTDLILTAHSSTVTVISK